jgi:hypothetical protein
MKEDYLWDKGGSDEEIEGLENSLKAFRQADLKSLPLPINEVAELAEKPAPGWSWFWGLGFAGAAACIALVMGLYVVLQSPDENKAFVIPTNISEKKTSSEEKTAVPGIDPKPTPERISVEPKLAVKPEREFIPQYLVVRRDKPAPAARERIVNKRSLKKKDDATLTPAEQDAYDKLMLALSITGSQLRKVKDRANSEAGNSNLVVREL